MLVINFDFSGPKTKLGIINFLEFRPIFIEIVLFEIIIQNNHNNYGMSYGTDNYGTELSLIITLSIFQLIRSSRFTADDSLLSSNIVCPFLLLN